MPEKRKKVQIPGRQGLTDVVDVGVDESTERWTDVKLDDGSTVRIKSVVIGAIRLENEWDNEGNPVYSLKVNQVLVVADSPEHLRKGAKKSNEIH